jgi:hypothetical protein
MPLLPQFAPATDIGSRAAEFIRRFNPTNILPLCIGTLAETSAPFRHVGRSQPQLQGDLKGIGTAGGVGLKAGGAISGQEVVTPMGRRQRKSLGDFWRRRGGDDQRSTW